MRKSCQYGSHYFNGKDACQCGKYKKEPDPDFSKCKDPEFAEVNFNHMKLILDGMKGIKD